jgi:hypothetical protein
VWPRRLRPPSLAWSLRESNDAWMAQSVDPTQPRQTWRFIGILIPFE